MLNPFDGWTLGHSLVGFFLGRIKLRRWLFYPMPIFWEIYQFYFHYEPQGYNLGYVWLNSLADIVFCTVFYELAQRYSFGYEKNRLWMRISNGVKGIVAYLLITFGIAWLFWDDVLRGRLSNRLPLSYTPLLLGALSPVVASFLVRTWLIRDGFTKFRLSSFLHEQWSYYLIAGFLPTTVIILFIVLIKIV